MWYKVYITWHNGNFYLAENQLYVLGKIIFMAIKKSIDIEASHFFISIVLLGPMFLVCNKIRIKSKLMSVLKLYLEMVINRMMVSIRI